MPQIKNEYEAVAEFATLANGLQAKYPEIFAGVDVSKIRCVAITNKERKQGKRMWDISPVKMPAKMDCPYNYYVVVFMKDWIEQDEAHRLLLVADILNAIPSDDDEGKILQPDCKDFFVMLRTFGIDYMDSANVPHLLKEKITWKRNANNE
jgi:hypothetical protein